MHNKDFVNLRKQLRELRTRSGLTQSEVAERLGLDHRTISAIETGKIEPGIRAISWYCQYFHITPNHLLGYDDYVHTSSSLNEDEQILIDHYRSLPLWRKKSLRELIQHNGPYIDTHEIEFLIEHDRYDRQDYINQDQETTIS